MDKGVLNTIREKGLLLEKEIYDLISGFNNARVARDFLEQLEKVSGQKLLTRSVLNKNVGYVKQFVNQLPGEDKSVVEKVFVNLGLSLEVRREKEVIEEISLKNLEKHHYKIIYSDTAPDKKLEVRDFTKHFRARYQQLQRILMQRPELQRNLVSINKISSDRTNVGIIAIVTEKRITKNKNLIITFEDLTGEIKALVKFDREEIFQKAEELQLDDVVGIKASGNRDILFVYDIFYPDSFIYEKMRFESDINVAFISDTHCGSGRHLAKSFNRFLEWINGDSEVAKKIKYLFFVGDSVDGVGIFPGQEAELNLKTMEEQYGLVASYLKRIPKHITIFMCPGQHDATRVAEPQPIINKKYAPQLYEIENLVLVTNPTMVKLLEGEKEFKVLMYHGASMNALINEVKSLRMMKAYRCPAKAVEQMLKRRHLAPMYGVSPSIVYVPNAEHDPLVISEVPDVLCTGEVHHLDVGSYNRVLIITGSCWQAQTPFEEKVGHVPDPCKVPVLNLKTRELKVFDFRDDTEVDEIGTWRGNNGGRG
ncbi:MAG: metallophosphoesterase [Nanoarchaeota archaeon]|nr:metallophosphoesterase [Nanoarchaeota archaeon]MBU1988474.1 metallophosphoesterase [Nanoarchaeota archaeon]